MSSSFDTFWKPTAILYIKKKPLMRFLIAFEHKMNHYKTNTFKKYVIIFTDRSNLVMDRFKQ